MAEFSSNNTPPEVTSLMGLVDTFIRHRNLTGPDRGYEIYHPSAFGKAQPLDAIVQTPYGPKSMGDIRIGDEVCGVDGTVNTVVQIHPQGTKPIFRVTFSDGDSTECCEDHLWEVDSRYLQFKTPKVMALRDIAKTYIPTSGHRHYQVRVPEPLHMKGEWNSVLTPYVLGVLLGDGCFRCGSPMITGNDQELLDRVKDELPDGVTLKSRDDNMQHWLSGKNVHGRNIIKTELHRLGLWGISTQERHVPEPLLYVDEGSRWALMQGLMDSDGTASKKGHPSFTSTSLLLAQQVAWLVKSLGGLARFYEKQTVCTNTGKVGRTSYTLHIAHATPERLFHLTRKSNRAMSQHGRRVVRNIRLIELVGKKECQCITVSRDDGLYLTDNCIVTHNCLRKMQLQRYEARGWVKGEKEELPSKKLRLFDNGHWMHDRWRGYFEEIGVLRGIWECTNPTCQMFGDNGDVKGETYGDTAGGVKQLMADPKKHPPRRYGTDHLQGVFKPDKCACGWTKFKYHELPVKSEELNFKGHADMILDFSRFNPNMFDNPDDERLTGFKKMFNVQKLPKKPIVVDMKSIGGMGFKKLGNSGMSLEYRVQLTIYANILDCEYGIIIYEDKDQFDTMAYRVDRSVDTIWKEVQRQAHLMQDMCESKALPPPRHVSKTHMECSGYSGSGACPFKKMCHREGGIWDDPNLEQKRKEFYGPLL